MDSFYIIDIQKSFDIQEDFRSMLPGKGPHSIGRGYDNTYQTPEPELSKDELLAAEKLRAQGYEWKPVDFTESAEVARGSLPKNLASLTELSHVGTISPDNDRLLKESFPRRVSRKHCNLEIRSDNIVYVTDLGSTYGTFINDETEAITQGTAVAVYHNDIISLGGYKFKIELKSSLKFLICCIL